jgi:hypothetical protein
MGHCRSIGPASVSCCVWDSGYDFWSARARQFRMRKDALHISPYAEGVVVLLLMGLHDTGQDFHACILQPVLLYEPRSNSLGVFLHECAPLLRLRQPPRPVYWHH